MSIVRIVSKYATYWALLWREISDKFVVWGGRGRLLGRDFFEVVVDLGEM